MAGGTNSPANIEKIYKVRARAYCSSDLDSPAWGEYAELDMPTGGWTWPIVSHLFSMSFPNHPFLVPIVRTAIFVEDIDGQQLTTTVDSQNFTSGLTSFRVHKIEIEVTCQRELKFLPYADIYPMLAFSARGKIGNLWIHKLYKERFWNNHPEYPQALFRQTMAGNQGRVITKYYYPDNPRTPVQQANRARFVDGMYNWSQLDPSTKNYYDELKYPIYAYGMQRYLRLYLANNPPMIIYWNTLEKSATDPARLPDYMASEYFGGVSRLLASTTYPATSPYGALRYRSDLKKFVGFKQDSGWGEIGAEPVIPVKATAAELNTGTDDAKFATALAIAGSTILKSTTTRFKVGSITRDQTAANGAVATTGVGFQPKAIILFWGNDAGVNRGVGISDGTNHFASSTATNNTIRTQTTYVIETLDNASWEEKAAVSAFGADGFTLTWSRGGAPPAGTIKIGYLVFA